MTPAVVTASETVSQGRAGRGGRDLLVQPDDTAGDRRKRSAAVMMASAQASRMPLLKAPRLTRNPST
jgi:hypothetical protein